jgi:hypothetical protein
MSNLKTARQAILAEIKYVEEGVAYYQKRAAALRAALEQLASTEDPATASSQETKASRKAGKRAKPAVTSKASSSKRALPKTSRDFWLGFIDQSPKTAAEIGNAAVASLGFTPTPEQAKQLKSRLAPTLQALLKSKAVKDTGSGRERKYNLASSGAPETDKSKAKPLSSPASQAGSGNGNVVHH